MKKSILVGLAIFIDIACFAQEDVDDIYDLFPTYYRHIEKVDLLNIYQKYGANRFAILGYTPVQKSIPQQIPPPLWTIPNGELSPQEPFHELPTLNLDLLLSHQESHERIILTYNENPNKFSCFIPLLQELGLHKKVGSDNQEVIAQKYDSLTKSEQISLVTTLLILSAQLKDIDRCITFETALIQTSPTHWNFLLIRALRYFEQPYKIPFKSFGRTVYSLSLLEKKECLNVTRIAKSLCLQFNNHTPLSQSIVLYYLCHFTSTTRIAAMNFLKTLGKHDECDCDLNAFLLLINKNSWEGVADKIELITQTFCLTPVVHLSSIMKMYEKKQMHQMNKAFVREEESIN